MDAKHSSKNESEPCVQMTCKNAMASGSFKVQIASSSANKTALVKASERSTLEDALYTFFSRENS